MQLLPQEIETWYLIPSIRKEIAKSLILNFKKSQKEVSKILGVTESAISQYVKSKRANELKFSSKEKEKIKNSTKRIIDGENVSKEIYRLCLEFRGIESLCKLHKKYDKSVPKKCELCMH